MSILDLNDDDLFAAAQVLLPHLKPMMQSAPDANEYREEEIDTSKLSADGLCQIGVIGIVRDMVRALVESGVVNVVDTRRSEPSL